MTELVARLAQVGRFTGVPAWQRFAYWCAALLVLAGLFHVGVFLSDGGPWEGPLSWRKPIVFGLSFGVTVATLAWVLGFLHPRRAVAWVVVGVLAVASVGEVALISLQTWRGVPSHFNNSTPFDETVFSLMGMLVTVLVVLTVLVTVWSFFRLDAPAGLALAIRAGLVLMLVGQAVGVQMILEGGNTFGTAGALKVPHALTLHAVQVLPGPRAAAPAVRLGRARPGPGGAGRDRRVRRPDRRHPAADVRRTGTAGPGPGVILLALVGVALLATSWVVAVRQLGSALHRSPDPSPGT